MYNRSCSTTQIFSCDSLVIPSLARDRSTQKHFELFELSRAAECDVEAKRRSKKCVARIYELHATTYTIVMRGEFFEQPSECVKKQVSLLNVGVSEARETRGKTSAACTLRPPTASHSPAPFCVHLYVV